MKCIIIQKPCDWFTIGMDYEVKEGQIQDDQGAWWVFGRRIFIGVNADNELCYAIFEESS